KVLQGGLKPEADDVTAAIAEVEVVAEFAIGGVLRVLRGERGICGLHVALLEFAVVGHFFGEVGVEFLAASEEAEFVEEAKDFVWHGCSFGSWARSLG